MKRALVMILLFGGLLILELGFLSSLPAFFPFLPLIFAGSLYLVQHHGITEAAWWMPGLGLVLDYLHLGNVPGETIIYAAAALITVASSRHFFSNRSLYGILACGVLSFLVMATGEGVLFGWAALRGVSPFSLSDIVRYDLMVLLALLLILTFLFFLAGRIRSLVHFYKQL